jgi:hypothetical protein
MSECTLINVSHLVTVLVALGGWFVIHRLSAWRDRINHNRKIRTEFLIKAFQNLANAANRPPTSGSQYFRDMEAAVADIQLFGSKSQIQMVESFTREFDEKKEASLDPLLNSLRADLRKELGYEPVEANVKWFRPEGSPTVAQPRAPGDGPPPAGSARP